MMPLYCRIKTLTMVLFIALTIGSCTSKNYLVVNYQLHKLSGDKKGLYAVQVSGNWRIFFEFVEGDAYIVDYDDYH